VGDEAGGGAGDVDGGGAEGETCGGVGVEAATVLVTGTLCTETPSAVVASAAVPSDESACCVTVAASLSSFTATSKTRLTLAAVMVSETSVSGTPSVLAMLETSDACMALS